MAERFLLSALVLALIAGCGDGQRQAVLPDPLPLEESDTVFVNVPAGVYVTDSGDSIRIEAFRLGRYEVSNRLYYHIARENGIALPPDPKFAGFDDYLFSCPDYPVVNVSMIEALAAAAGMGGRLPSRAEWQYAASLDLQGDDVQDLYPWGILDPVDAEYPANYLAGDEWETRALDGYSWTAPVDSFPLTDAGLASMAGNVAEWTVSPLDSMTSVCGGSWLSPSDEIKIGSCRPLASGDRARHIGFRILLPAD